MTFLIQIFWHLQLNHFPQDLCANNKKNRGNNSDIAMKSNFKCHTRDERRGNKTFLVWISEIHILFDLFLFPFRFLCQTTTLFTLCSTHCEMRYWKFNSCSNKSSEICLLLRFARDTRFRVEKKALSEINYIQTSAI